MALFELEDGRLFPAQFGRPVANGVNHDVLEAVRNQVLEIVSRPLFPITWRDMSRVADPTNVRPRLTALDATGQVVSVEVVETLDSETLISSLSRLADTAALSWTDLAREYPGGLEAFKAGWMQFRDSMPPSPAPGPRLVMVVGSIDLQVRPALDVLASSGVEVHEMSLRQMSNGRAFLEVHAVGPRIYGHVPQLLLGRTEQMRLLRSADGPGSGEAIGHEGAAETGSGGGVRAIHEGDHESDDLVTSAVEAMERPRHARSDVQDDEASGSATAFTRTQADEPVGDVGTVEPVAPTQPVESPEPAEAAGPVAPIAPVEPVERGLSSEPAERTGQAELAESAAPTEPVEVVEPSTPPPGRDAVGEAARAADAAAHSAADLPRRGAQSEPVQAPEGVPVLGRNSEGLEALGQIVGEDVPLEVRPAVQPQVSAVLTSHGRVRLGDTEYDDPTQALAAGGVAHLDGWLEWHVGDALGPSLAESLDEVNSEIVREYTRAGRPRQASRPGGEEARELARKH